MSNLDSLFLLAHVEICFAHRINFVAITVVRSASVECHGSCALVDAGAQLEAHAFAFVWSALRSALFTCD